MRGGSSSLLEEVDKARVISAGYRGRSSTANGRELKKPSPQRIRKSSITDKDMVDESTNDSSNRLSHFKPSLIKQAPIFSSSCLLHAPSKGQYVHLETSPSVDSSETSDHRNTTTTEGSDHTRTRVFIARERMKLLRQKPDTVNQSSSNDDIDPPFLPTHDHSSVPSKPPIDLITVPTNRRIPRQGTVDQASLGPGVFLTDGHRPVDFILVYQTGHSESLQRQRRYFEKNLRQEGLVLEVDPLDGVEESNKLCFVKIHAPWDTLCRSAEMLQMKMPLKNARLPDDRLCSTPNTGGIWAIVFDAVFSWCFRFNDTEKLLIGRQPNHVTAQFTRARIEQFLINDTDTFFTSTQRIRIVYDIMQRAKCDPDNSKKRGLQWLLKNNVFSAAYPPHDGGTETRHLSTTQPEAWSQRQILKHTWANFNRLFKPQPLNLVRTYFGEKVGFYFAWLGFYTQMLVFPSIVGVICFLYGVFSLPFNPVIIELCSPDRLNQEPANLSMCPVCALPYCQPWTLREACEGASWNYRFDHESHVVMAVFTLAWATVFMELWKRREAELACEWDAYDAEQEEQADETGPVSGTRAEYEARTQLVRVSPVTNEEEPFIGTMKRVLWSLQSLSGLFMLILCVIAALVALITVRIILYGMLGELGGTWKHYQFELASLIIHVLTFVIVMTLGWIYEKSAHRLTELECPRTQADYLSSYIWKVFIFELLNNFAPVLYAALIRGRTGRPQDQSLLLEMCDPGGCLNEVVQAIAILLLARLLISNAAELGVPFLKSVLKTMRLGAAVNPEHDEDPNVIRNLPRWQKDYTLSEAKLDGVYAEYLEMMVQFGYVTLFVSVFPLAPLICLLNNLVEIRLDATNFTCSFRRPLPSRVSGIRIWRRCLNILIKLSVLCNGAFLAFTSELIPKLVYRLWYSPDGSTHGYIKWTLARVDTTTWPEYSKYAPANTTECYYRDFRQSSSSSSQDGDYGPSLVWWQVMVAKLAFFIVFVITFYFFQWLCDFLVPDVPHQVKLRVDRANYLAKQALYGHETRGTSNSNNPTPSSICNSRRGPWTTRSSISPSPNRSVPTANGGGALTNGLLVNGVKRRITEDHGTEKGRHLQPLASTIPNTLDILKTDSTYV